MEETDVMSKHQKFYIMNNVSTTKTYKYLSQAGNEAIYEIITSRLIT